MKLQKLEMNKKGQIGLEVAKSVFVAFLILAVIAVAIILALTSLRDVTDTIDKTTITIHNLTTSDAVTEVAQNIPSTSDLRNCVLTVIDITNQTGTQIIQSANYTISECTIAFTGSDVEENNTEYNITGSYIFSSSTVNNIQSNISNALTSNFFNNTGTIMAILIVIVIILAIAIIVSVVTRFSGVGITGGGGGGKTGGFGSDTVMGV